MIGNELKTELKKRHITHVQAAEILGVSRNTLSIWFGKAKLDDATLHLIKTKLDINISNVITNNSAYEIDAKGISNDYLQRIIAAQEETISSQKELINALKEDTERLRKENITLANQLNTYK